MRAGILNAQKRNDARRQALAQAEKYNVVGAGGAFTAAYEQLRNAAENTDEHLLLQNAIRRFFKQLFIVRDETLVRQSGTELVIELTFAGYIPNDNVAPEQIEAITELARQHYAAFEKLQKRRSINADRSTSWVLETLSVRVAQLIAPKERDVAFMDFAYEYFEQAIPRDAVSKTTRERHRERQVYSG